MKNRITRQIKQGKFKEVLKALKDKFSFPKYYEELVVYLSGTNINVKVSVRGNNGTTVFYRDHGGNQISELHLESSDLKNILIMLKHVIGDMGHISISPVLEFRKRESIIYLINNSLIGPIITVINKHSSEKILSGVDHCLLKRPPNRSHNKLWSEPEKIIDFDISHKGVLNDKIISYVERNGIFLNRNKRTTYKEVLEAKSNDYSIYADIFKIVTNHHLISTDPLRSNSLLDLHAVTASVIIPCYNTERTITQVLEAIKHQYQKIKIKELEVILIDDGSVNPVSSFISRDYPFTLRVVRSENNRGLSSARNIGATISKGDILIFIDSDILLEKNYIKEHLVRNLIIPNAVFVSFKENVEFDDVRINHNKIFTGLEMPNYSKDLRIHKIVKENAVGSYKLNEDSEVEILESTNYFKSFSGSRVFGVYDLSCMVIGHNFSARRDTIMQSFPFTQKITGWGMEDVYFGLRLINNGNFIIPVLSTGVYHINHSPRSGSEKEKINEYKRNTKIIDKILNTEIKKSIDPDDFLPGELSQ